MKQTVNFYDFKRAFEDFNRLDNFSPAGLKALFEYIEDIEDSCDIEIEFDVIALCCEYSEYDIEEIVQNYCLEDEILEELKEYKGITEEEEEEEETFEDLDKEEVKEYVMNYLYENTQVIIVDEETVIIADF